MNQSYGTISKYWVFFSYFTSRWFGLNAENISSDNNVSKFRYSRPFYRNEDGEDERKFANLWLERTVLQISSPLPGILKWFPVVSSDTHFISPLKNAIEMMQESNKFVFWPSKISRYYVSIYYRVLILLPSTYRKLRELILSYKNDQSASLNPLTLKLKGIVDPAVMGGIRNYEEVSFAFVHHHRRRLLWFLRWRSQICAVGILHPRLWSPTSGRCRRAFQIEGSYC